MLQPVISDEDDYIKPTNVDKHLPSAVLEIEAGSGLYSTSGTRQLNRLTTPAECIQMISDSEHLPTITFIRRLCMEHGRFVAFVPRNLKFVLQERHIKGVRTLEENRIIEAQRSLLRTFFSHIGLAHPNPALEAMPHDWDLTAKLTGGDENCAPFFASIWYLVSSGALRIVGKTGQGVILEPTERLFHFSGGLEENPVGSENPDLNQDAM